MGTLTADQPRLDHYCEHKLPTSCRLSSLGKCCACSDERPHAVGGNYSVYIDGIGYVPRGTRWQRYCWFCKEFWQHRVEVSGLLPSQTRIPQVPDIRVFLTRWYEFHQGYRLVKHADGSEERVAVVGEDFRDVSPGVLPRTLEELRAGRDRREAEENERQAAIRELQARERLDPDAATGPSIEETLDQLLESASTEGGEARGENAPVVGQRAVQEGQDDAIRNNIHAQAMVPLGTRNREYQARRIAALRRELHRMRNGIERVIEGLRDLGEEVPDHSDASNQLTDLGQTLDNITGGPSQEAASRAIASVNALTERTDATHSDQVLLNMQHRVSEARQHVEDARRNRDQAASELDEAEREFRTSQSRMRQLQNEQRTAENYMRLFGTREQMAAQGEAYQSPIGDMFHRAYERFHEAEQVRREERTLRQVLEDEARSGGEGVNAGLLELERRERDVWGVPQRAVASSPTVTQHTGDPFPRIRTPEVLVARDAESDLALDDEEVALEQYYTLLRRQGWSSEQSTAAVQAAEAERAELPGDIPAALASGGSSFVAGPPGQQLDAEPSVNNDRGLDALFVLTALSSSESLRSQLAGNPTTSYVERLLRMVRENNLSWNEREHVEAMLEDSNLIWGCGLPAERMRRRRQRGESVGFTELAHEMAVSDATVIHDVEVMAEVFQMSAHLRRCAGIGPSEQLQMMCRLQRGERTPEDRAVLCRMLQSESTYSRAKHVHDLQYNREVDALTAESNRIRQQTAREGDHSRGELDARRRATHALALAAGRIAMRSSPAELLERLSNRDEASRAAHARLQENGAPEALRVRYRPLGVDLFPSTHSETDSEPETDEDAKGLDAKDTGRPAEPASDEQLTVRLDCQVCYSQLADMACLPCGHLVMCQWCSDQHSPTMAHDRTRPRRAAACPVCRKQIRQKVRVFRA